MIKFYFFRPNCKRKHKFKLYCPTYMVKLSIPRLNNEMSTNDAKKCDKCSLNQHTLFRIEKRVIIHSYLDLN